MNQNKNRKYIDATMQAGYDASQGSNHCIQVWTDTFNAIVALMVAENIESFEAFDKTFQGRQMVFNWISDYEEALYSQLINEQTPDMITLAEHYCTTALQYTPEGTNHWLNTKRMQAELCFMTDQTQKGVQYFEALTRDFPNWTWGWIGYSDQYWMYANREKDHQKALDLLMQAAKIKDSKEDQIILERIIDLSKDYNDMLDDDRRKHEEHQKSLEELMAIIRTASDYPYKALYALTQKGDEAGDALIEVLETLLASPHEDFGDLPLYAATLLGEMGYHKASRPLVKLFDLNSEVIDKHFGDLITEAFHIILYRCFIGEVTDLKTLIEKESLDTYHRLALLKALSGIFLYRNQDRQGLIDYLFYLGEFSHGEEVEEAMSYAICSVVLDYQLKELLPLIKRLYEDQLVNRQIFGSYEIFLEGTGVKRICDFTKPFDGIDMLSHWSGFSNGMPSKINIDTTQQMMRNFFDQKNKKVKAPMQEVPQKKVGRNDPCPCGSGKKYKKCCLN